MKRIFSIAVLLIVAATASGQIYQPATLYGKHERGLAVKRMFMMPTGCGDPAAPAAADAAIKMAGSYFDSCAHRYWLYDPKYATWDSIHVGVSTGSGGGFSSIDGDYGLTEVDDSTLAVDSSVLSLYYLRRKDSATASFLNGYLTRTSGLEYFFGMGGNTVTASPILGTINNYSLRFRVNNIDAGILTPSGGISFGIRASTTIGTTFGYEAFENTTSGGESSGFGFQVGKYNKTGSKLAFFGMYIGNITGSENAMVGVHTFESNTGGSNNAGTGNGFLRWNMNGSFNAGSGQNGGYLNTTVISGVTITNGGSGYVTPPTVTFSSCPYSVIPGIPCTTATGTAIISGGAVIGVTMNLYGNNYGYSTLYGAIAPTVTFSGGGGTGATGTVILSSGNYNTMTGAASNVFGEWGQLGTFDGFESGYGAGGNEANYFDDEVTHIGANSSRHGAIARTTKLTNITSIGANSKIGVSNAIALGDSVRGTRVGIGTGFPNASAMLDVVSTTRGLLMPRMTGVQQAAIVSPATGLIIYNTDSAAFTWFNGSIWQMVGAGTGSAGVGRGDFGVSGQDDVATENRDFDGDTYDFTMDNFDNLTIQGNVANFHGSISQISVSDSIKLDPGESGIINIPVLNSGVDTTLSKPLTYNSSTKRMEKLASWPSTGSASQGLNDVLTVDPDLTANHTINGNNNALSIDSSSSFNVATKTAIGGRAILTMNGSVGPQIFGMKNGIRTSYVHPSVGNGASIGDVNDAADSSATVSAKYDDGIILDHSEGIINLPNIIAGPGTKAVRWNGATGNLEIADTSAAGGGGTPGGSDTQVQFNDAGAFGGDAGLTYDKTTNVLTITGGSITTPLINGVGNVLTMVGGGGKFFASDGYGGSGMEYGAGGKNGMYVRDPYLQFATNYNERMRLVDGGLSVGTTSLNASAVLQAESTTTGFLPPRMTTTQKNAIASPAAGLIVFDITLMKLCVFTTVWETITSM